MSRRWIALAVAVCMIDPGWSAVLAQTTAPATPPAQPEQEASQYDPQQLDALLAPIALYPDQLLTQILMAATFPLQIVEASRWLDDPAHKTLTGDALDKALQPMSWDPSVKSLVPFPQVMAQLNTNLDWTQQLGYAFANQQKDVLDSVQRLRQQAQAHGQLKSTEQQVVKTEAPPAGSTAPQTIIIEPAQPNVVYVPTYNPTVVYGTWPYPAYPPVVVPPPPGYAVGTALAAGLAFGAGVAITGALWGWSRPNWYGGNVNVNVNRWNNINVHNNVRVNNGTWNAGYNRPAGRPANLQRPPGGPVGRPVRNPGLPPNAIGRPNVSVPSSAVNRPRPNPGTPQGANRPNLSPGSRPNPPAAQRPPERQQARQPDRQPVRQPARQPGAPQNRPANMSQPRSAPQRGGGQGGAFNNVGQGHQSQSWGQRGAQSRQFNRPAGGGGGFHGRSR
jgi:hypothetical protein